MSVYKKTCGKTGRIYYGSTGNDIKIREEKGHYKCSCGDFVNAKMEVLEYIEDKQLRYERELYYIRNFECVNISGKGRDPEYREKNKEKINESIHKNRKRIYEEKLHDCTLCDITFLSNQKLKRHIDGYRHKLKYQSFLKYGDDWREHYLDDNKKKYNETRRIKSNYI